MTALTGLVADLAALLAPTDGNDECLTGWIEQARDEDLPHLHACTRGPERDRRAVDAALTHPYHNGRTEGSEHQDEDDQAADVRDPPPCDAARDAAARIPADAGAAGLAVTARV